MTIVWFLLRSAGILLLALLLLLLAVVLLVLFVPIRYRAQGSIREKKPDIWLRVSWLFHIVHITVTAAEQTMLLTVRLAGIVFWRRDLRGKQPVNADGQPDGMAEPEPEKTAAADAEEKACSKFAGQEVPRAEDPVHQEAETSSLGTRFGTVVKTLVGKCRAAFRNLSAAQKAVRRLVRLLARPETKRAFVFVRRKGIRLLKSVAPKKYRIQLHFGKADDPALMGRILMYLSMLYPFLEEHAEFVPDFEQTVLEGEFYVRGRVRVGTVLWTVLCIWRNRDVRFVRRGMRKWKANAV